MKVTIDLAQSPKALQDELTRVIRLALGLNYFIDSRESGNFTGEELADPNVNLAGQSAPSAVVDLIPPLSGAAANLPPGTTVATGAHGTELDSEGHPHDIRIHSAGKTKIKDGTWKLAKGMSDKKDYVAQINAQNKSLLATPLPTSAPSNVVSLPTLQPLTPSLPELPPVAQVAAPDVEIVVSDYASFAAYVGQQMAIKPNATKENTDKGLTHYGLVDAAGNPDLTALAHKPEAVLPFHQWLKAMIGLAPAE